MFHILIEDNGIKLDAKSMRKYRKYINTEIKQCILNDRGITEIIRRKCFLFPRIKQK
jgi:hypothetical protein